MTSALCNFCIVVCYIMYHNLWFASFMFLSIFYWLCCYSCPSFFPFAPLSPVSSFPPAITPLSSCPWAIRVSSLASPFPILFLTSPCLFCSYQLCFLIPAPFLPFSPFPLPADNPPNDPHTYDSVPVLVVCLVCFCFYFLDSVVDSCEFVVILMFIVFIFFFFLNKSL